MIEIRSISKNYKQKKGIHRALQNVSLTIEKGDIFGIIGSSGAGKSTLIRCLARLITPCSGKIFFEGRDLELLKGEKLRAFRKEMGMIFQHFNLLHCRTVAQNIAYPLEISRLPLAERVEELLQWVGLSKKRDVYPSNLSGGEKQRVGIARALATNPKLLLCDEATSALDPRTRNEILDLLKNLQKRLGLTIVLITHDMEVIKRICNKVAVLEDGVLVEEGAVEEVFSSPQHATTKEFIERSSHGIPSELFQELSSERKVFRLRFKGKSASEPLISQIVKRYGVEANILLGWIDQLPKSRVGTLILELQGSTESIERSLAFLREKSVDCEGVEHGD